MKALILAAGRSRRMNSILPKWALEIYGMRIIDYLINTLRELNIDYEVGIRKEQIKYANFKYFIQDDKYQNTLGPLLNYHFIDDETYLILHADMPFISEKTIRSFIDNFNSDFSLVASVANEDYQGVKQRKDKVIFKNKFKYKNMGIYLFKGSFLNQEINKYINVYDSTIPNLIEFSLKKGYIFKTSYSNEFININNRDNLSLAKNYIEKNLKEKLKDNEILDYKNTIIDIKSKLYGNVIYPNCKIINSIIKNSIIKENSIIVNCTIENNNVIGPFAYISDSNIGNNNEIGTYIQIKRSIIEDNNKMKHFLYLGDINIKSNNNFGAMIVISNYNGNKKFNSYIESNNFIGSFTNIISPLKIGNNNYIASSTKLNSDIKDFKFIKESHLIEIKENAFIND